MGMREFCQCEIFRLRLYMDHVYLQTIYRLIRPTPGHVPGCSQLADLLLALNDVLKRFRKTSVDASLLWEINIMHGSCITYFHLAHERRTSLMHLLLDQQHGLCSLEQLSVIANDQKCTGSITPEVPLCSRINPGWMNRKEVLEKGSSPIPYQPGHINF